MQEFNYQAKKLGTDIDVVLVCDSSDKANQLAGKALLMIDEYESRFSRFLPDSELSRLNARQTSVVSDQFIEVLNRACELCRETNGVYNPLLQIKRLGYTRDFSKLGFEPASNDESYNACLEDMKIDVSSKTVFLAEGQQLDFGGFLKGYLAQKIVETVMHEEIGVQGMIVNLGGDLCTIGADKDDKPFTFSVFNPVTKEDEKIIVQNTCLATSGTYKRTWHYDGELVNHIMNTDSKNPDNNIISASVVAKDGALAEGSTKVFLCTPFKEATEVLKESAVQYLLIDHVGKVTSSV